MSDNIHPQLAGQAALPYLNRFLDPTSSVLLVLVTVVLLVLGTRAMPLMQPGR